MTEITTRFEVNTIVQKRDGERGIVTRRYPLSLDDVEYRYDVEFGEFGFWMEAPHSELEFVKELHD